MARPARRAISELLPVAAASAAVTVITGPLLEFPYRIGKPLRAELTGLRSVRLGNHWRVVYWVNDAERVVIVQDIQHRSAGYRHR